VFEALGKYGAIVRTRYQTSGLPRFLEWWRGELRPLIPPSVMRWFEVPGEKLLITSTATEWLLWRSGKAGEQLLDRLAIDTDPEQLRERLQACLDRFQEALTAVIYCLPSAQSLCKRLRLPIAVEANLQQAVGFELDRQTPFKADEVYYDVKVVQRDAPFIDVDLFIILRSEVDAKLQQLARLGLNLQGVDIDRAVDAKDAGQSPPQPLQINLLPPDKRGRRSNRRVRINWALAASALVLVALLMFETLYLRGNTLQQLQQQRDALRSEAMQVSKLEQQLDEAIEAANFLAEQQARTPMMLDVLAEVTSLLPEHTWILRMQMTGKELELLGLSDSSQQMIELLDQSEMLGNTSFKGTIATDRRLNKERFTATAQIDPDSRFTGSAQSEPEATAETDAVNADVEAIEAGSAKDAANDASSADTPDDVAADQADSALTAIGMAGASGKRHAAAA